MTCWSLLSLYSDSAAPADIWSESQGAVWEEEGERAKTGSYADYVAVWHSSLL